MQLLAKKSFENKTNQCLANGLNSQYRWLVGDIKMLFTWKRKPEEFEAERVSNVTRA
jgi:hypothetical protein